MPVNHAVDKARTLALRFTSEVAGLEMLNRRAAKWEPVKLEQAGKGTIARFTLAPGDGELLRVVAAQKQ
jgi:hypothetical protein